ncbi:asparagine synthetase domain-containing protein CG17486-like isoform X1 [Vespa mandarinia]|uniref:asparagine synthetase domain-containing protein CG17486-like isoform X1 n=1 Tax=Vespa mandarinia TaxID=7446 RepID=UPI00161DA055|nr:asparagine synthetase domain-containing protein CG17486-like isoform X1 [Vespa mandarinia]XP_035742589.1 asparagine synthetase domain-containing protein CG17486-like isoform X1 [Vespa mandarinia]XP_035742590.1 asparagine synthetase domain-containing protein CG17486-like isoform X1 [Vespa mandarinia]XP_035742591.1 asparagine synthetase domain-containing protein CG17486-like isoform X1 [Vespa mandarinia]XP_035742592.1 asparagine synthetase domain-containing protein CG17486-like isoform X1 [Ves
MCGIFCCISQHSEESVKHSNEWDGCKNLITSRGPDKLVKHFITLTDTWCGHFAASILWMQGLKLVEQPLIDSNGNILLWNGDVLSGSLAKDDTCDSITILNAFSTSPNITNILQYIQGPYSFIYFQKSNKLLYFGRDIIGRHSLLLQLNNEKNVLTITSVGAKCFKNIMEVPAIGIFAINLSDMNINLTCYPWKEPDFIFGNTIEELRNALNVNINIKETIAEQNLSNKIVMHLHPTIEDLDYLVNNPYVEDFNKMIEHLLKNEIVFRRVEYLSKLLHKAVEVRIKKKPNFCKNCILLVLKGENIICDHAKIGILFSGGLDSAILTLIAHKYVSQNEPIDLINVAFEKIVNTTQKNKHIKNTNLHISKIYDVPDRKTGRQTLSEILQICPNRKWNLVEVDVTQPELQKYRSSRINDLLYPLCTILDESLGCAMWFASRAQGIITKTNIEYESPCRVLLLGIGADELFGGYMRHRKILKHKGWNALKQELDIELAKISQRNLGRDDRIVSDHGRQSRLPYLDENVVEYVQQLQPWERCYPTEKMPSGLGDKLLLRLLARNLGLQNTATFPKRAFQFGSRIANSKENAKDISKRL